MIRRLGFLIFVLLLSGSALAQLQFGDLVKAVEQGDDDRAVRISQKLEEQDQTSFGLYYNQGLAYRNQGQAARARASFERALLYSPRDLATRRRLREVKERLSPEIAQHDVTPTPWWTLTEARFLLALAGLFVLVLGIGRATGRPISSKQTVGGLAVFALLATALLLTDPPASRGVIVSSSARLLSKAEGGANGPIVPEGVLVKITDRKGHFVEVATREGKHGWVRDAELVLVDQTD